MLYLQEITIYKKSNIHGMTLHHAFKIFFFEKIMNNLSYKRGIIICCRFPWLHKTGNSNYVYKIHINFHSQQERYYINLRILYKHQLLILSLNLKILKYLNKRKLKCKCTQKNNTNKRTKTSMLGLSKKVTTRLKP